MRPGSGQRATETRLNPARGSRARGCAAQAASSRPAAPPARLPEPGSAVTRALRSARRSSEPARPTRSLSGRVSGGLGRPSPRPPASRFSSPGAGPALPTASPESPRPAPARGHLTGLERRARRFLPARACPEPGFRPAAPRPGPVASREFSWAPLRPGSVFCCTWSPDSRPASKAASLSSVFSLRRVEACVREEAHAPPGGERRPQAPSALWVCFPRMLLGPTILTSGCRIFFPFSSFLDGRV